MSKTRTFVMAAELPNDILDPLHAVLDEAKLEAATRRLWDEALAWSARVRERDHGWTEADTHPQIVLHGVTLKCTFTLTRTDA